MKRFFIVLLLASGSVSAADMETMAEEMAANAGRLEKRRIAVMTFEGPAGSEKAANAMAEELTFHLVKTGKFTVIERSQVSKVLQELAFQQTGAVDAESAKKMGAGLGAEAIITGKITDSGKEEAIVYGKMIRTETFDIVGVSQITIKRSWNLEEEKPLGNRTYFDVFGGYSHARMNLQFTNTIEKVNSTWLTFTPSNVNYSNIEFPDLETKDSYIFGGRILFFIRYIGFGMEVNHFSHSMKKQITTGKFDGFEDTSFNFAVEDYLRISHTSLALQLLAAPRFFGFFEPYLGAGMALTITGIKSDLIYAYSRNANTGARQFTKGLDETGSGLLFHSISGIRLVFGSVFSLFAEYRFFTVSGNFDRDINSEKDSVGLSGWQAIAGIGYVLE